MGILVIAEHNNRQLLDATKSTIQAALKLEQNIHVLVAGFQISKIAEAAALLEGVEKVILADSEAYQHFLAENIAALVEDIGESYQYILASATTFGKNIIPRVAALFDVQPISDVIDIITNDTFVRPIYAGNALATVQSGESRKLMTIRATAFDAVSANSSPAPIESVDKSYNLGLSEFIKLEETISERPDLSAAKIVVSGGRGLQTKEDFQRLIEPLADKLNAAIGASRAAVDAGFVPNDYQVGQTGKVVAPELYFAIGISGAIQHLAGMKDSKLVVAINKDEEAPIFQVADYGIVGDLFKIVPELLEAL